MNELIKNGRLNTSKIDEILRDSVRMFNEGEFVELHDTLLEIIDAIEEWDVLYEQED